MSLCNVLVLTDLSATATTLAQALHEADIVATIDKQLYSCGDSAMFRLKTHSDNVDRLRSMAVIKMAHVEAVLGHA